MEEDNDIVTVQSYREWVSIEKSLTAQIEELKRDRKAIRKMIDAAETLDEEIANSALKEKSE